MTRSSSERPIGQAALRFTRRQWLKDAMVAGAAWATGSLPALAESDPYAPFKMGVQSYSLRGYDFDEALQKTLELGLTYWEAFPAHIPVTTDLAAIRQARRKLDAAGIRLRQYGVVGFGGDVAENRRVFEFARLMGIDVLSADPAPESFPSLERLVEEFRINIAIHNHGPGARYSSLESVMDAVKGRNRRIGACIDTGHYLRSRVDPVVATETLGSRVYGVHLKDVRHHDQFTVLGDGDLDLVALLRVLRRQRFSHVMSLEYEDRPEDPMEDMEACMTVVRQSIRVM